MADADDWVTGSAPAQPTQDAGADDWVTGTQASRGQELLRGVGNTFRGVTAGAMQSWRELGSDFTSPIDTQTYIPHSEGIRGELEAPFAPSIGVLEGLGLRGAKIAGDVGGLFSGAIEGAISPVTTPVIQKGLEATGMEPEEARERAEAATSAISNIPLFVDGAIRAPHLPEVNPKNFAEQSKSVYTSPVPASPILTGEMGDASVAHSNIGPVLDAFGEGPRTNWGVKDLVGGLDTKTIPSATLKDMAQAHAEAVKAFNEAFQRSAASSALVQAGPTITEQLAAARSLAVIGEGEAGWKGTIAPDEASAAARIEAGKLISTDAPEFQPPTVHEMARQVAPEVFGGEHGYDALLDRQNELRTWLGEARDRRDQESAATPPMAEDINAVQDKIDGILGKVNGVEEKLTKTKAGQLSDLRDQMDDLRDQSAELARQDTEEMQRVRQAIQQNDYKMRDLAPQVSAAYREAAARLPEPPVRAEPIAEQPKAEVAPEPAAPEPVAQEIVGKAIAEQSAPKPVAEPLGRPVPQNVAADVSQKLQAAGRPAEEADAAGQLIQAHYEARAARFNGALGTGPELYAREAPEVRAGRVRQAVPEKEFAQTARGKIAFRNAQSTITLMKDANASTFIHESGHQWLEELMRDASDARAPEELRRDAQTVRNYLDMEPSQYNTPTTRQHEKFARSFERYMMEGVAPSKGLADVFAKFKNWLTQIYQTVAKLRAPINDDIRAVFDRLVGQPEEKPVIAPESEPEKSLADIHEADALHTAPEHADHVGDVVADEVNRVADRRTPDLAPTLANDRQAQGVEPEAPGGAAGTERTEPGPGEASDAKANAEVPPGGGNAAAEGAAARASATAYRSIPKEPKRLIQWIKEQGGIRDDGGDISTIIGGAKGRPGLLSKKGVDGDTLAHLAWQAGYLPEFAERPTANDLFAKIEEDARGNPVYSANNLREAEAFNDAVRANEEIDHLAAELGIDPKGLTRQQFLDAVAEHMSVEEQSKWIADHADILDRDLQDAIKEAQDELGDAWEGAPTEYDVSQPRTFEDLENDAAEGSRAAAGAGDDGQVSPDVADTQGEVPADRGEVGPAGANAGQSSPAARPGSDADRTLGGDDQLPPAESELVDKAGNIRLDNIDTPEDFKQALREAAERNGDFLEQRRGVVSDAQRNALADVLGTTPDKVFTKSLGESFTDSEIKMLEKSLAESAMKVHELAVKAANGTEADVAAMTEAYLRHDMIQGLYSQATAEAGRALRALRRSQEFWSTQAAETNAVIKSSVADATGKTFFQMQQIARRIANLDTAGQITKFTRDAQRTGLFDWIQSTFINALISGPFTHMGYTAAGEMFALFRATAETSAAAGVGAVRQVLGKGEAEYAHIAEMHHQLYGMFRGGRNGIKAAWQALKSNEVVLPPEVQRQPDLPGTTGQPINSTKVIPNPTIAGRTIPIGSAIESPGRLVAALHSFNWTTFYSQSIAGQAFRQAIHEGIEVGSQQFANRVADLTASPTDEMIKTGMSDASSGALMERPAYDSLMGNVSRLTNWGVNLGSIPLPGGRELPLGTFRPLKYIDPFVQIQANIQKTAFGRGTPLALFSKSVRDDLSMRNGGVAFDRTAGRIIAGTGFMIAMGGLAAEGLLNSSAPSDPRQAREWQRVHGLPHGLTIGNLSFDTLRMGNLGMQMSVAADLYQVGHMLSEGDMSKAAAQVVQAFAQNIVDESSMRGPAELMKAIDEHDRYGDAWIRNFASSAIPFSVGLSQVARQIDPYSREARTTMDAIKAKIPFVSESLLPRYDVWGQPVANRGWAVAPNVLLAHDPVDEKLYALGIYPSMPERRIRGVTLTDQQYADYSRVSGRLAHINVSRILQSQGFDSLGGEAKIKIIDSAIGSAREQARNQIMMQSVGTQDDIVAKALAAKRQGLH